MEVTQNVAVVLGLIKKGKDRYIGCGGEEMGKGKDKTIEDRDLKYLKSERGG